MPEKCDDYHSDSSSASKKRLNWSQLPAEVQAQIEHLAGGEVARAANCEGGYSPGLASRLTLADGRMVFCKAMNADAWPDQARFHRAEAAVSAALPASIPAPRMLGCLDDTHWVVLVFEGIEGSELRLPADSADVDRVVAAIEELARAGTPSPIDLPKDHPRLGGWADVMRDPSRLASLSAHSAWAAEHLRLLAELEERGLAAASGRSLVHFDLFPHNVLVTRDRVLFADWPHARLGAPFLDLVMFLTGVAAAGIDPEAIVHAHRFAADVQPQTLNAVISAIAGFMVCNSLYPAPPGLEPIIEEKMRLGLSTLRWLARRLGTMSK